MTLPNSLLAYQDCVELMDRALEDELGARVKVESYDKAIHQRTRIHYARSLHRRANAQTYEVGHPMHNASEYDKLTVRIRSDGAVTWLYLERTDKVRGEIEPLSSAPEINEVRASIEVKVTPTEPAAKITRRV